MDFPSRDEARVYATLQSRNAPPSKADRKAAPTPVASPQDVPASPEDKMRFRIEKPGFESDVFDRRSLRNLIRSGELTAQDRVRVDDADPVRAGELPYLKSLFSLRQTSRVTPPLCCRTHTDRVAHFSCTDTSRPLCEDCAPIKKFGSATIRVCQHCGGTARDLVPA